MSAQPEAGAWLSLSHAQLEALFPFHIVVDRQLCVTAVGKSLLRPCKDLLPGVPLESAFKARRPEGPLSFQLFAENGQQLFVLEHLTSKVLLRGQLLFSAATDELYLLGSPWITSHEDMAAQNLTLNDFALHDAMVDLLQLVQAEKKALEDANRLAGKLSAQQAELRAANERLRQQEAEQRKLALIAERTDNAVVLTDVGGRVVWVNNGFTRLTGYTLDEVIGKKPGGVLQGPGTDPATVSHIRTQLRKGEGFSVEILNYGKDGQSYWVATEVQPIHNERGAIVNFMAIQSNVTERRAAQQRLSLQSEVSRALAQASDAQLAAPEILRAIGTNLGSQVGILWRAVGNQLELTAEWSASHSTAIEFIEQCRGFQLAPGIDLPGRVLTSRSPMWIPDVTSDPDFTRAATAAAHNLRGAFAFPVLIHGECWGVFEFFNQNIQEPDTQLLHTLSAISSQIGQFVERTVPEQLLINTSALQRAILAGANYSIISTDQRGTIQLFNAGAERLLGYAADEVVDKVTPGIFHDAAEVAARAHELTAELGREVKPGFEAFVAKAELGQPDEREWTYIRKDGTRFPILLSVTALFDDVGKITGYLGIASDLTNRKRDEEKLRNTFSELERFNRIMLNREQRVVELKNEVNQLLGELGRPIMFKSVEQKSPKPRATA